MWTKNFDSFESVSNDDDVEFDDECDDNDCAPAECIELHTPSQTIENNFGDNDCAPAECIEPSQTIENEPIVLQTSSENQHVHREDPYEFQESEIEPTPLKVTRRRKQTLVARKEPHRPIILLTRYVVEDNTQEEDDTQTKTKRKSAMLDCDPSAPTHAEKKKRARK